MKKILFLIGCFLLFSLKAQATHNKSGEISYVQIGDKTIECTITTYTNTFGTGIADRDSLEILWGDGESEIIRRVNGSPINGIPSGEIIGPGIRMNKYIQTHTYDNFGDYIISMTDPNRNFGILNVNYGASVDVPFHLETAFKLSSFGFDNSPIVLIKPIDVGNTGGYMHIPNAYDIDGDSLSYRLIVPLQAHNDPVPGYVSLEEIALSEGSIFEFDEATGLLYWDSPSTPGEYAVAMEILSYRNGVQVGRMVRDMQILISFSDIPQPNVEINTAYEERVIHDVGVGDVVEIQFDVEGVQEIELIASSELLDEANTNAEFELIDEDTGLLTWTVAEHNVRPNPYNLVIGGRYNSGIVNYKLFRFSTINSWNNIDEITLDRTLRVYPNPCKDFIHLDFRETVLAPKKYQLLNAIGKIVDQGEIITNETINTSNFKAGIYFLKVEGREAYKVIVD